MSFVAVAIGGSALVGAGASIYGANKAADAQSQAANSALQFQQQAQGQAQQNYKPYLDTGKAATYSLASLMGLPGQDGSVKPADYSSFYNSPDYAFAQQQGELGIERGANARGMNLSGGTLRDLASFNSGLASQQYGNYFNRLMGLSQLGQQSATGASNAAMGGATAMGNAVQAGGQAQASGYVGAANAINSGINSGVSNSLLASYLNKNPSAYSSGAGNSITVGGNFGNASYL